MIDFACENNEKYFENEWLYFVYQYWKNDNSCPKY